MKNHRTKNSRSILDTLLYPLYALKFSFYWCRDSNYPEDAVEFCSDCAGTGRSMDGDCLLCAGTGIELSVDSDS